MGFRRRRVTRRMAPNPGLARDPSLLSALDRSFCSPVLALSPTVRRSLDLKELRSALLKLQAAAKAHLANLEHDEGMLRTKVLRKRAKVADEAAESTAEAEHLENELLAFTERTAAQGDVQLGALLARRKIKPGAVVTHWAKGKGEHAGELSKKEFRVAVLALGLSGQSDTDIDKVFNMFDSDGGGYMDANEAKEMIRSLQRLAEEKEHETFRKTQAAQRVRAIATKKGTLATAPLPENNEQGPPSPSSPGKPGGGSASTSPVRDHGAGETSSEKPRLKPKKGGKAAAVSKAKAPSEAPSEAPEEAQMEATADAAAVKGTPRMGGLLSGNGRVERSLFSGDRGKRKKGEAESKAESKNWSVAQAAATRMLHLELSVGFNTWRSYYEQSAYKREQITQAARKLLSPWLSRAFATWATWHEEHTEAMGIILTAARVASRSVEMAAFRQWVAAVAAECEAAEVRRHAVNAIARLRNPKLLSAFDQWHQDFMQEQMERRREEGGQCTALAFWLRTTLSRRLPCVG